MASVVNERVNAADIIELNCSNVLFGYLHGPDIINFIILVAKQVIVAQRHQDAVPSLQAFRPILSKMFEMEKIIAVKNARVDTFRDRWAPFVESDNVLVL